MRIIHQWISEEKGEDLGCIKWMTSRQLQKQESQFCKAKIKNKYLMINTTLTTNSCVLKSFRYSFYSVKITLMFLIKIDK